MDNDETSVRTPFVSATLFFDLALNFAAQVSLIFFRFVVVAQQPGEQATLNVQYDAPCFVLPFAVTLVH